MMHSPPARGTNGPLVTKLQAVRLALIEVQETLEFLDELIVAYGAEGERASSSWQIEQLFP